MALRLTEQPSLYDHLESKSVAELLRDINNEDKKVPLAVEAVLPDIEKLVNAIEAQLRAGGRFFWLGAGTGGKIGVLDVLEVPNTYGVDPGRRCLPAATRILSSPSKRLKMTGMKGGGLSAKSITSLPRTSWSASPPAATLPMCSRR